MYVENKDRDTWYRIHLFDAVTNQMNSQQNAAPIAKWGFTAQHKGTTAWLCTICCWVGGWGWRRRSGSLSAKTNFEEASVRGFRGCVSVQVVYHHRWMLYWPSHGALSCLPLMESPPRCTLVCTFLMVIWPVRALCCQLETARTPFVPWVIIRATCVQSPCINKWASWAITPLAGVNSGLYHPIRNRLYDRQTQSHQNICRSEGSARLRDLKPAPAFMGGAGACAWEPL
jgi:hypothetical protein